MPNSNEILAEIARRLVGPNGRLAQRTGQPLPANAGGFDMSWLRPDGTKKSLGYLGPVPLPNGSVATEYSIADSERLKDAQGNYRDYPSIVPTLTLAELMQVIAAASDETHQTHLPDSVYDKAESYAVERDRRGLPLFAQAGEQAPLMRPAASHATLADIFGHLLRSK